MMPVLAPLRDARTAAGLSYAALADRARLGVRRQFGGDAPGAALSYVTVAHVELGTRPAEMGTAYAISVGLGAVMDAIWPGGKFSARLAVDKHRGVHPLKAMTLDAGTSVRELARDLGITARTLYAVIQGTRGLSAASAASVARHFNVTTHSLVREILAWQHERGWHRRQHGE